MDACAVRSVKFRTAECKSTNGSLHCHRTSQRSSPLRILATGSATPDAAQRVGNHTLLERLQECAASRDWRSAVELFDASNTELYDHCTHVSLVESILHACKRASHSDRSAWKGVSKALALLPNGIRDLSADGAAAVIVTFGRGRQWSRLDAAWSDAAHVDNSTGKLLNAAAYCSMITFCDRRRDQTRALQLTSEMIQVTGPSLDFGGASVLTKIFGRGIAPLWEDMLDALCHSSKEAAPPNIYPFRAILNALASISRDGMSNSRLLKRALEWGDFNELPHRSDRACVRCGLEVLRRAGDASGARTLLYKAHQAGCQLEVSDFNFAVAAARVQKHQEQAWKSLRFLEEYGNAPNDSTFASLTSACAAAKDPDALQIAIGQAESTCPYDTRRSSMFRSQLAGTLANCGRVDEALSAVDEAHSLECPVDDDAGAKIASAAAELHGAEGLEYSLRRLTHAGIELNADAMVLPVAHLDSRGEHSAADRIADEAGLILQHQASRISALGAWNNSERAEEIFRSATLPFSDFFRSTGSEHADVMGNASIRIEGMNELGHDGNPSSSSRDENLAETLDSATIAGLVALLEAMIEVYATEANYEDSKACLKFVIGLGVRLSQGAGINMLIAASQVVITNDVTLLQAGIPEVKEAAILVQKACEGMQVDAWNIVLWAFAQSGQWFDALRTHEQMDSAGIVPNADTWAALAHAAEKSGQWRIAADVLADAKASSSVLDEGVYSSCIRAAADSGEWSTVRSFLEELRSEGLYPGGQAYLALIQKSVQNGHGAIAIDALEDVQRVCERVHRQIWELGLKACAQQRKFECGMTLYRSASRQRKLSQAMLCHALELCGACKEMDQAHKIFDEAKAKKRKVHGRPHAALVRAYGLAGLRDEAVAAYRSENPSSAACTAVLSTLATEGKWQLAEQIVNEVKESHEVTDEAYASVVEALWRGGKRQDAITWMKQRLKEGRFASTVKHGPHVPPWKKKKQPRLEQGWPRQATHWASSAVHLDIRGLPAGAAQALVTLWLGSISTRTSKGVPVPQALVVFTGEPGYKTSSSDEVRNRVFELLQRIGAPFELLENSPAKLYAMGADVKEWLDSTGRDLFLKSGAS